MRFRVLILLYLFKDGSSSDKKAPSKLLSYSSLLPGKRVALVLTCGLTPDNLHYGIESTLALKLRNSFGYPTPMIGLFFGIFLAGTINCRRDWAILS